MSLLLCPCVASSLVPNARHITHQTKKERKTDSITRGRAHLMFYTVSGKPTLFLKLLFELFTVISLFAAGLTLDAAGSNHGLCSFFHNNRDYTRSSSPLPLPLPHPPPPPHDSVQSFHNNRHHTRFSCPPPLLALLHPHQPILTIVCNEIGTPDLLLTC